MKNVIRNGFIVFISLIGIGLIVYLLIYGGQIDVLNPKGIIAEKQRNLIVFTVLLSLLVVVPVFVLLGVIAWKYRATNKNAPTYTPNWDNSKWLETIWWGIPVVIILVLSVITWNTSHELDPYKPLDSAVTPVEVQVVALQWKWLFIYPEYNVASVNELYIPNKTPINFTVTSDAPMNSFWIPSLGGQVYAMSGMSTKLHLMADKDGEYAGSSANISGEGFADMKFTTYSRDKTEFMRWIDQAKRSGSPLDQESYAVLAKPSSTEPKQYALSDTSLYDTIVMKYMAPMSENTHGDMENESHMEGMN